MNYKKYLLLFFVFILNFSQLLFSQDKPAVILELLLKDTQTFNKQKRIETIITVSDSLINKNKQDATIIVNFIINYSKKCKYKMGVYKGYNLQGDLCYNKNLINEANKWYELAYNETKNSNDYDFIAKVVSNLAAINYKNGNNSESINLYKIALKNAVLSKNLDKIADIHGKMCLVYMGLGDFDNCLNEGKEALKIRRDLKDRKKIEYSLSTLGNAVFKKGDYKQSLDYHLEAIKIAESINDSLGIANCYNNIGIVYNALAEFDKALEYYIKAVNIKQTQDYSTANTLNNIALIYKKLKNYPKALEYNFKSLEIKTKNKDLQGIGSSNNNLGSLYSQTNDFEKAIKHLDIAYDIFSKTKNNTGLVSVLANYGVVEMKKKNYNKALEYLVKGIEIAKSINSQSLALTSYGLIVKVYELKGDYKQALYNYKEYFLFKDSLFNETSSKQITEIQTKYETEKKIRENELLKKDKEIQRLELVKSENSRKIQYGFLIFLTIIVLLIFKLYKDQQKANEIINYEKEKSDQLLINILPIEIAKQLKDNGKSIPKSFDDVTVLFSDLVNFTEISSHLSPIQVIEELNDLFTEFDNIIEENMGERIKTIGDAYLAVCGMPEPNPLHAINIVKSAVQIVQFVQKRNMSSPIQWSVRIGVHTGKVVGGVVGIKKYIYDIFGDTINTTSRIESQTLPMQINVSETTFELVKNHFSFEVDKEVHLKGKGVIKLYSVVQNL